MGGSMSVGNPVSVPTPSTQTSQVSTPAACTTSKTQDALNDLNNNGGGKGGIGGDCFEKKPVPMIDLDAF
ncbi:MAG TPA: hypothetical protein VND93_11775 [Myxococcales bacterium]|nr:hypothetical protein [Myxococcales bacterium]